MKLCSICANMMEVMAYGYNTTDGNWKRYICKNKDCNNIEMVYVDTGEVQIEWSIRND